MTSASESNSTPNALVLARQPRNPAVEHVQHDREPDVRRRGRVVAPHRVHDAGVAAEHVRHREQARQQVHAPADAAGARIAQRVPAWRSARGASSDPGGAPVVGPASRCTVSPPRTRSPTRTSRRGRRRHEHVHARTELHQAEAIAGLDRQRPPQRGTRRAAPARRRPAARPPVAARYRSRSRCARSRWRPPACTPPGTVPGGTRLRLTTPPDRHPVDVHVHRREEDADLLPLPGGATPGWAGPATITRPSAGATTRSLAVSARRGRGRGRSTP